MFMKLKNALAGSDQDQSGKLTANKETIKYPYSRPHFLHLNEDEIQASIDHRLRPIISPSKKLANFSGYAECINGGKSRYNEDQAVTHQAVLASGNTRIPYVYFGLFDGHAGVGAAICAANQLHHVLHQRLVDAQDDLWSEFIENEDPTDRHNLVIGALEMAFTTMDDIIKEELVRKQSNGGCTAIAAIAILGYVYVANAGDSRAIVCSGSNHFPLSNDFTPETERERIRKLAQMKPDLLGKQFTYIEYIRQPKMKDLGKRILFKDSLMKGWSYKTISQEDLKPSIITGQGKRSRVMGTIGVTRGFGDHDLVSVLQKIPIKPFLSCHPEVQVYDLMSAKKEDVLVMGTDGLWDVLDGDAVAKVVSDAMDIFDGRELYVSAATCLVGAARGTLKEHQWLMKNGKTASVDDISVFVIPLYSLAMDHVKMVRAEKLDGTKRFNLFDSDKEVSRDDYLSNIIGELKVKQQQSTNSSNFNDVCIVRAEEGDNAARKKKVNVVVTGNVPSKNDDFLLVNLSSVDSIDVLGDSNELESPVNVRSVKCGSLELVMLEKPKFSEGRPLYRTRSFPCSEFKLIKDDVEEQKPIETKRLLDNSKFLCRIKLKRSESSQGTEEDGAIGQRENF